MCCESNANNAAGSAAILSPRLIAQHGRDYRLTDWLHAMTRDCPHKQQSGVTRACHAIMPDLARLR
jgi:hypothetical protein